MFVAWSSRIREKLNLSTCVDSSTNTESIQKKRNADNALFNIHSKTASPNFSTCNALLGVSLMWWLGIWVRRL